MSSNYYSIPELKPGMVVVTPAIGYSNLTPSRKYIINRIEEGYVFIKDDLGKENKFRTHLFMEADVYFTMCLYLSLIKMLQIINKI